MRKLPGHLLIAAAAALLSVAAVTRIPFAVMGERWLADYRVATLLPSQEQQPDIVVVAVTEDTLAAFPYRSPLDRDFLASLVETLERDGVRAIGVDILLDQPTEPAKDARLRSVLAAARIPIVVAAAAAETGLDPRQTAYLRDFVPASMRGLTNLAADGYDGTVRTTYPGGRSADGTALRGLPFELAAKLGIAVPDRPTSIAWHGRPSPAIPPFRTVPAQAVRLLPPGWLAGRIVLIGAELSLTDRHRTPFSTVRRGPGALMPGIEIHAHVLAQLLEGRRPGTPTTAMVTLTAFLAAMAGILVARLPWGLAAKLAMASASTALLWVTVFALYRADGVMLPVVSPTLALAAALWAAEAWGGRQDRKMKRFILDAFSKYVAPGIVTELIKDPARLKLGGERREISILFTDLAGFTSLSEVADPDALGRLLNLYLGAVSQIILDHQGTVIDFIGDAVLAIFGAPLAQAGHAANAVACARAVDAYSTAFRGEGVPAELGWGVTRIGVHAGTVLVGNFGGERRFKYSAVGDAVNAASRLEGLNKHFGTRAMASAEVLDAAGRTLARPLGRIILKGRHEPTEVFELVDAAEAGSAHAARYRLAYAALDRGDIVAAEAGFAALAQQHPDDLPAALHLGRIRAGATDTVILMAEK